jgi:excisionase family DNA binding protein
MERLAYPLKDAVAASGLSRSEIYRLLADGRIVARKAGRRTLITAQSLHDYIEKLPAATFRPPAKAAS